MHEINNIDKCIKNVEKSMKISIVHHSHLTKYTLFFQEINLLKLEYMHVKLPKLLTQKTCRKIKLNSEEKPKCKKIKMKLQHEIYCTLYNI